MKRSRRNLMLCASVGIALTACATAAGAQQTQPAPQAPQSGRAESAAPRPNGSLWNPRARGWAEDVKASRVGDTITIVVQETTTATSTAATKGSRSDSASFGGGTGLLRRFLRDFGASATNSVDGSGQTSRSGTLATRLSAIVKEVLPNGNLVVEGTRTIGVNAEKQKVVISGVVRPQDINPDNTVSSIALANASIQYDGKGPVGDRQRPGLLSKLFGWLF